MNASHRLLTPLATAAIMMYPRGFRTRFGAAMRQAFVDRVQDRARTSSAVAALRFAASAWWDLARNGVAERLRAWRSHRGGDSPSPSRRRLELRQDVQFALRMVRRQPGVAGLSIVTLAAVLGAASTVFGLIDASLLRPLDLPHPERLVALMETSRGVSGNVSYDNLRDWQRDAKALAALTAFRPQSVNLTGLQRPTRVRGGFVTSGFFGVAGVGAARGRVLAAADDLANAPAVVVVNHTFWQNELAGTPDVLGRVVQLNNVGFEIVGVMPAEFRFPFDGAEVWIPLRYYPGTFARGNRSFFAFGRLAPGASIEQARTELNTIAAALAQAYPDTNTGRGVAVAELHPWLAGGSSNQITMVFALVIVLLVAAAANVTSLQLGATLARREELAIRLALGAGRGRLIRQLLIEQLTVAGIAGVLGLFIAAWLLPLVATMPLQVFGQDRIALDLRVILFCSVATLGTGIVAAIAPAWHWSVRVTSGALRSTGRSTGDRRTTRVRAALVSAQVAMAAVLLVASGLLVKSYLGVLAIDPGFTGDRVVTMEYRLPANKYATGSAQAAFHQAVVERVAAVPGVTHSAVSRGVPISGNGDIVGVLTEHAKPADQPRIAAFTTVSDEYFRALGIPLLKGRTFDGRDHAEAPGVVVVSERLANDAWPGKDPIGQTLVIAGSDRRPLVIGVVGNIQQFGLTDAPMQAFYARVQQNPGIFMTVVAAIGGSEDPTAAIPAIRRAVWSVDPDQPIWKERTLGSLVQAATRGSQFMFAALGIFAVAALLLVVAGLYGVVSQHVAQRGREIGIRMILGANRHRVVRQVLARGLVMTGIGVLIGLPASFAVSRLLERVLYRTSALDLAPYSAAVVALVGIALVACYVPARKAASVDPAKVTRDR